MERIQKKMIFISYLSTTTAVNGKRFSIFFDSGCGDFVSRYDAIKRLVNRSNQEVQGPIQVGGVVALLNNPHMVFTQSNFHFLMEKLQ